MNLLRVGVQYLPINNHSLIPWPARKEVEGQQKKDVRNVSNSL